MMRRFLVLSYISVTAGSRGECRHARRASERVSVEGSERTTLRWMRRYEEMMGWIRIRRACRDEDCRSALRILSEASTCGGVDVKERGRLRGSAGFMDALIGHSMSRKRDNVGILRLGSQTRPLGLKGSRHASPCAKRACVKSKLVTQ